MYRRFALGRWIGKFRTGDDYLAHTLLNGGVVVDENAAELARALLCTCWTPVVNLCATTGSA